LLRGKVPGKASTGKSAVKWNVRTPSVMNHHPASIAPTLKANGSAKAK